MTSALRTYEPTPEKIGPEGLGGFGHFGHFASLA